MDMTTEDYVGPWTGPLTGESKTAVQSVFQENQQNLNMNDKPWMVVSGQCYMSQF